MSSMVNAFDVRDHMDAWREELDIDVYAYGEVPGLQGPDRVPTPGVTPPVYVLAQIERIETPRTRMDARAVRARWRASMRAVGHDFPDNCREALARLLAVENQRLVVAGHTTTPVSVETTEDATPDGAAFSALARFTYAT